jgi:hypothetical protein
MPAPADLPTRLKIVHEGSGEELVQPLLWRTGAARCRPGTSRPAAKLGSYRVELDNPKAPDDAAARSWTSGDFRVEEFRVPLVDARLCRRRPPGGAGRAGARCAAELPVRRRHGAPRRCGQRAAAPRAAGVLPATTSSASSRPRSPAGRRRRRRGDGESPREGKLVADKQPLTTDREGAASFHAEGAARHHPASELVAEVTFNDPNGEVQTVSTTVRTVAERRGARHEGRRLGQQPRAGHASPCWRWTPRAGR